MVALALNGESAMTATTEKAPKQSLSLIASPPTNAIRDTKHTPEMHLYIDSERRELGIAAIAAANRRYLRPIFQQGRRPCFSK